MSENSASDTQIRSLHSSELEGLFDLPNTDLVVVAGAHVLLPKDSTLDQLTSLRTFINELIEREIEKRIYGPYAG